MVFCKPEINGQASTSQPTVETVGTQRSRNQLSTPPSSTTTVTMGSNFWAELLRALFDPSPPFTPETTHRRWGSAAQPNLRLPRSDWTDASGEHSTRHVVGDPKFSDDSLLPDGWGM
ncbi:hypothetical protein ACTXT7_005156 [Hymenolepis weldensis]